MKNLRLKLKHFSPAVLTGLVVSSCSPTLYFVDRQTVLEAEASGEWPDVESRYVDKTTTSTTTSFKKDQDTKRKQRIYSVLNGEVSYTKN